MLCYQTLLGYSTSLQSIPLVPMSGLTARQTILVVTQHSKLTNSRLLYFSFCHFFFLAILCFRATRQDKDRQRLLLWPFRVSIHCCSGGMSWKERFFCLPREVCLKIIPKGWCSGDMSKQQPQKNRAVLEVLLGVLFWISVLNPSHRRPPA